jgi:hypothetical protein
LNSALNLGWNDVLNLVIRSIFCSKKIGQFGQNWQPRVLRLDSNKYDFLKPEYICNNRADPDFFILDSYFSIYRILRHGIFRTLLSKI